MKLWTQAALGLCVAASLVACNNNRGYDSSNPPAREGTVGTSGANVDRDFIEDQLEDGNAEVAIAKLATERATHPQVKEFAQKMVQDHEAAGEALKQAAARSNVQVNAPADLDND